MESIRIIDKNLSYSKRLTNLADLAKEIMKDAIENRLGVKEIHNDWKEYLFKIGDIDFQIVDQNISKTNVNQMIIRYNAEKSEGFDKTKPLYDTFKAFPSESLGKRYKVTYGTNNPKEEIHTATNNSLGTFGEQSKINWDKIDGLNNRSLASLKIAENLIEQYAKGRGIVIPTKNKELGDVLQ